MIVMAVVTIDHSALWSTVTTAKSLIAQQKFICNFDLLFKYVTAAKYTVYLLHRAPTIAASLTCNCQSRHIKIRGNLYLSTYLI